MKIIKQGKDISLLSKEELKPGDEILLGDRVFVLKKYKDEGLCFSIENDDCKINYYLKYGRFCGVAWNEDGEFISPKVCWHVRGITQVNKKTLIKIYE